MALAPEVGGNTNPHFCGLDPFFMEVDRPNKRPRCTDTGVVTRPDSHKPYKEQRTVASVQERELLDILEQKTFMVQLDDILDMVEQNVLIVGEGAVATEKRGSMAVFTLTGLK